LPVRQSGDFAGDTLRAKIFLPAGWKEKALRLRRHRLAEQDIRGRMDAVGSSPILVFVFDLVNLLSFL
jgi:hypothetical protein